MQRLLLNPELASSIDASLDAFFQQATNDAKQIDPSYQQLWEVLHSLIRSGGKRLRPRLTVLAYQAFGGNAWESIVPVATAQELLHFSLLIHDDIIDRDFIRYGTLNVAGRYKTTYAQFLNSSVDQTHFANGAALLAGDLMLSGAYQLINESSLEDTKRRLALGLLSKSIFDVAGGELLDTESSFTPYSEGDALKIAHYKTARYSFVTPLLTGARLAGANETDLRQLETLGTNLGIAYQLVDDLLGVFGDEATTGKSASGDIREGKRTYLVEQALAAMSSPQKEAFHATFGNPLATPIEIEQVKTVLTATGAKAATEEKIQHYAAQSLELLDTLPFDESCKEQFTQLIQQVTERSY